MILQRRLTRSVAMIAAAGVVMFGATTCGGGDSTGPTQPTPTGLVRVSGENQSAAVGQALSNPLVVKVVDGSGAGVAGVSITWTVTGGGGSASPLSGVTDAAGITSASWTLGPLPGANTVTAGATGRATIPAVTFTATAVAGPPTKLAFTVQPSPATAGVAISPAVQVTVQDAQGNTVTSATTSVTLAITSGTGTSGAVLGGTLTVAAVNGVATFANLTVDKVGAGYTLTATATSLTSAVSTGFNVNPGTATKLAFTGQPSDATAGVAITPAIQVIVQDAQGNTVTGATTSVTLALTSGTGTSGAVLGGTLTVAAVGGVATFSDLTVDKVGPGYTLTATATSLTSASSAAFNITLGGVSAARSAVTVSSGTVASGGTVTLTLQAKDASGNNLTTGGATVTFSASGGTSTGTIGPSTATDNGNGTYAATFTAILAGTATTIGATIDGTLVTSPLPTVTVTSGAESQLVFTAQPTNTTAGTGFGVAVTARDAAGNTAAGFTGTVALAITAGTGKTGAALAGGTSVAAVAGIATFSGLHIDSAATGYTLTTTSSGLPSATSAAFNVTAGAASIFAKISGDNLTGQVATALGAHHVVKVTDGHGNPVAGVAVTWAAAIGGGSVSATAGTTTAQGRDSTLRTLGATAGAQTTSATATVGGVPTTVTFNVTAMVGGASQLTLVGGDLQADTVGATLATALSVRAADASNNPVVGVSITWSVSSGGGSVSPLTSLTDATGVATTHWTLGTVVTTADSTGTVTASGPGSPITFTATRRPGSVNAAQSTVAAVPGTIAASSGSGPTTITVTAKDGFGNLLSGRAVVLAATGTANTLTQPAGVTNGSGVATGTLSSTKAEGKTVSATVNGVAITQTAALAVTPAAIATSLSVVTASAGTVVSGGTVTLTLRARDAFGNNLTAGGAAVGFSTSGGTTTGTIGATTDQGDGTYTAVFTGVAAGTATTIGATIGGVVVTSTPLPAVTVRSGAASQLEWTQQPSAVAAGAMMSPAVTVAVQDAQGNTVTDATVSITLALTSGTGTGGALLGGTLTVAAVSGVATFSNLTLDREGTGYTITATATSLATATSAAFNVTPPQGVRLAVTSPWAAIEWYVVADSGTLGSPQVIPFPGNYRRADTLMVPLPAGSGYRLRLLVADSVSESGISRLVTAGGRLSGVSVLPGALTPASLAASALSAVVTLPDTVATAGPVPIEVTLSDPSQVLSEVNAAVLYSDTSSWVGDGGGAGTDVTWLWKQAALDPTTVRFAGLANVPAAAGRMYSQVLIQSNGLVARPWFNFFVPSTQLGQPLRTTTVLNVTPIVVVRLAVTSPRAASRWYVLADSGTLASPRVTRYQGNSRRVDTLLVSLPAGSGYRLRLLVADSASMSPDNSPVVTAGGLVSGVNAVAGSVATWAIAAEALSAVVTMPDTVAVGEPVPIDLTLTDPSQVLPYEMPSSASFFHGSAPWATDAGGALTSLFQPTRPTPTTMRFVTGSVLVPSSPGTLYSQVGLWSVVNGQAFHFYAPSRQLNQALRTTTVVAAAQAAKLAFVVQPSAVVAGATMSPAVTVAVQDAQGNPVASATTNVTLALTSGTGTTGAVLGGTLTVAAVDGVATFSGLSIDSVGTGYTLTASATSLTSATSTSFSVPPSTGVRLVVTSPVAASRWYVVADSGTLTTPQVMRFPGNSRRTDTLSVALPAGSGYRLRLVVADSASVNPDDAPLPTAGGQVAGVSVVAGSLTQQALVATALSVVVSMPDTVAVAGPVPVDLTMTDPSQVLSSATGCAYIFSGSGAWATDGGGSYAPSLCTRTSPSPTTIRYTGSGVAPASAGTLFSQVRLGNSIAGQFFFFWAPSRQLGQPLRTTAVVVAAQATKLAFTVPPSAVVAGATMSPAVQVAVQDEQGNTVAGATTSVTLALTSGAGADGAVLSGTLTVAAVNGVATYSTLAVDLVGTGYTLTATATGLTSATSNAFEVAAVGTGTIGSQGGTVASPAGGATVTFTAGAVSGQLPVQVRDTQPVDPRYPLLSTHAVELILPLTAAGAAFQQNGSVQLTIPIDRDLQPGATAYVRARFRGVAGDFWSPATVVASSGASRATASGASRAGTSGSPFLQLSLPTSGFSDYHAILGMDELDVVFDAAEILPLPGTCPGIPAIADNALYAPCTGGSMRRIQHAGTGLNAQIGVVLVHGWLSSVADGTDYLREQGLCVPNPALVGVCDWAVPSQPSPSRALPGIAYFKSLIEALGPDLTARLGGAPLYVFDYQSYNSYVTSGGQFASELERVMRDDALIGFIIVGHSMGGLVARQAAQILEAGNSTRVIRGIIALATPHTGTPLPSSQLGNALLSGLPTEGGQSLIYGLAREERAPLILYGGDIATQPNTHGVYSVGWRLLCPTPTVNCSNDGAVPTSSALPSAFAGKGVTIPRAIFPGYDHSQMSYNNGWLNDPLGIYSEDPLGLLYPDIVADIESLLQRAGASELAFSVQPAGGVSGTVIPSIEVEVRDGRGNPIGTPTFQVNLSLGDNPSNAILSGTTSVTTADGVATFSDLSIDRPGSGYTLVATAVDDLSRESDSFAITGVPAPTVASVSPSSGPVAGGTSVTITGTNFVDGATATIGGNALTGLAAVSSTQITGITPASSSAGAKDVVVTTEGGASAPCVGCFTYLGAQTLAKLSGDGQTGLAGAALAQPLVVKLTEANGTPISGQTVTFEVTGGGGSVAPLSTTTDAEGLAQTIWTLGASGAQTATASIGAGVSGSPATFTASAVVSTTVTWLITHFDAGLFLAVFDTPSSVTWTDKYIYHGSYPDESAPYQENHAGGTDSFQTLGCGQICGSSVGQHYWFKFVTTGGTYVFEVERTGSNEATGWAIVAAGSGSSTQFSQQGPKLVGTGAVGNAVQGRSVSVSADGNTAIVGGPDDNGGVGAAWAWTRSGGVWTQQGAKLVGTGAVGLAGQGLAVSISADGNTAIVGGPSDTPDGAAWVWTRSGGVWTQQGAKLVGSGTVGSAQQGYSVSISADGNTAIVGGLGDNSGVGAAWVWTRSGGVWTQQGAKVVGSGAVGLANQGYSVSISADGNTAIVGGDGDNSVAGAAWIWTRSGGVWTQQGAKLVGSGAMGNAYQGWSVTLSADGNTAIVGGIYDNSQAGAVWVWTRNGEAWTQEGAKLVGSGADGSNVYQGSSVSVSGDGNTVLIGGSGDAAGGAAWVWTRSGGVWMQQGAKLVGSSAVGNALQGVSVSLSSDGNTAIVGGIWDNGQAGAAWVFAAAGGSVGSVAAARPR